MKERGSNDGGSGEVNGELGMVEIVNLVATGTGKG